MKALSKFKYLIFILFFAWQFVAFGQTFKKREMKRLQVLSLQLPSNDSLPTDYIQSLQKTLKFDKKYRTNHVFAIGLTTLGIFSLIEGFSIEVPPKSSSNSGIVEGTVKDVIRNIARGTKNTLLFMGFVSCSVSIPLWMGTKKNRLLRDTQINVSRKRFKEIEESLKQSQ